MATFEFRRMASWWMLGVVIVSCDPARPDYGSECYGLSCPPAEPLTPKKKKTDAGIDAGIEVETDGGSTGVPSGWDGGTTVSAIKGAKYCGDRVHVDNVVVTAIANAQKGSSGDYKVDFWVSDVDDQSSAVYVTKHYTDLPKDFLPQVGDVLSIDGYLKRQSAHIDRIAYRETFGSMFDCPSNDGGILSMVKTDGGVSVVTTEVDADFGAAEDGTKRPNSQYRSARVSIPGPLVVINPSPNALKRISSKVDDTMAYGFEVSGGILVNNAYTFDRGLSDGGTEVRCDFRKAALDAGSGQVVFPNGISGVWDTYSHAPCRDGSTGCKDGFAFRDAGYIPGTNNTYTYTLYPIDCDDLPGYVDAGQ